MGPLRVKFCTDAAGTPGSIDKVRASMNSFRKQRTLVMMTGFERYTKKTRRAMFLEEMEHVVPWGKLCLLEIQFVGRS